MIPIDIKKELKNSLLFQKLPDDDIDRIVRISSIKTMAKRNLIFSEGDEPEGFYIVIRGAVKLFHLSIEGKEDIIKLNQPGQSLADKSCFSGEPHKCFAETKKLSSLIYIPIFQFKALLSENPNLNNKFISAE